MDLVVWCQWFHGYSTKVYQQCLLSIIGNSEVERSTNAISYRVVQLYQEHDLMCSLGSSLSHCQALGAGPAGGPAAAAGAAVGALISGAF